MADLPYKDEVFKLAGLGREIQRKPGKSHDEVIYKDAFGVGLHRATTPFPHEQQRGVIYKGGVRPHFSHSEISVREKILFAAKAVERLMDVHCKQLLNFLAAAKLKVGLPVNFGADAGTWKRVGWSRRQPETPKVFRL